MSTQPEFFVMSRNGERRLRKIATGVVEVRYADGSRITIDATEDALLRLYAREQDGDIAVMPGREVSNSLFVKVVTDGE